MKEREVRATCNGLSKELHHAICTNCFCGIVLPSLFCRHVCGCCSARRKTSSSTLADLFLFSVVYVFLKGCIASIWDYLLITSDTNASVTSVIKVVAITTYSMNQSGTTSSSDTSPLEGVITKVVRVGPTTVNTANCNPMLCTVNVAVSKNLPLRELERVLNLYTVRFGLLLAPRVRKNSVSIHYLQPTSSITSSWVDPVSLLSS